MKEFFLILFYAKALTLTVEPIDIENHASIRLKEPLSAITSGAHVRIDVTKIISGTVDLSDTVLVLETLKLKFPNGSIKVTLSANDDQIIVLDRISGSTNGKTSELILSSSTGVPTGVEFSKLEIESSTKLSAVTVIWQNYSK
jgi:hypothetical protein